jgi:hypothetical protein
MPPRRRLVQRLLLAGVPERGAQRAELPLEARDHGAIVTRSVTPAQGDPSAGRRDPSARQASEPCLREARDRDPAPPVEKVTL